MSAECHILRISLTFWEIIKAQRKVLCFFNRVIYLQIGGRMETQSEKRMYYKDYAEARAKKSDLLSDCIRAFIVGGFICTLGQLFVDFFKVMGVDEKTSGSLSGICLIFLAAILTGIGVFDKIAKVGGAGTLVPITGFANSVVAPAIDNKAEGLVLGLGAKIFIIAGPVILYGTLASVIYGFIYWLTGVI